jgi:hypothetical protein
MDARRPIKGAKAFTTINVTSFQKEHLTTKIQRSITAF